MNSQIKIVAPVQGVLGWRARWTCKDPQRENSNDSNGIDMQNHTPSLMIRIEGGGRGREWAGCMWEGIGYGYMCVCEGFGFGLGNKE